MKTNSPLISVIIPTFNRKEATLKAINSVLNQRYQPIETIVVDDGSTDGTYEYLHSLGLPIKLIKNENHGVSSARNIGIKEASGEYIAFLDSDDVWLPDKLNLEVDYLLNHPNISLVYTDEFIEVDGKRKEKTRFQKNPPKIQMIYPGFVDLVPIQISSVLIKKEVFNEVGYFNESLKIHEDSEFWNRVSDKYEFGFITTPLVIYNWSSDKAHLMDDQDRQKLVENGKKYLEIYVNSKRRPLRADEQKAVNDSYKIIQEIK